MLEVDSHGKIVGTNEHKLYPPGLVFGVPNEALKGKHISRLLPVGERPVTDLFEAGLAARKGAIKSRLKKSHKRESGMGDITQRAGAGAVRDVCFVPV